MADAIAAGALTVTALKNGAATTRALLPGGISQAARSPAERPCPVSPAQTGEAEALLDELLAVRSEGWRALAATMSKELFDRLKRWRAST